MHPMTFSDPRRGQHIYPAHILAAKALGGHHQLQRVPLGQRDMQHGRGIVAGVHPAKRIGHHRAAQIPLGIATRHAAVDRVGQKTAGDIHLLPQPGEDHRHTGILADRQPQLLRRRQVIRQILHNMFRQRLLFPRPGGAHGGAHVLRQTAVGLDAQSADRFLDLRR